jgi:AraC family transcriptional regulator
MRIHQLFRSSLIGVAEFVHPLNDGTWEDSQALSQDVPLVVFPRFPVMIRQAGSPPVLAGPNVVMFYRPDVSYSREARHPQGDHYLEFQLQPQLCEELQIRTNRMWGTHAPADGVVYLSQRLLVSHLRGAEPDPLFVEETAVGIVRSVLASKRRFRQPLRSTTRATHRELAETAKEVIGQTLAERLTLVDVAARVGGISPTHLARIFRSQTGFGLHEWRLQLRLRTALDRLDCSGGALSSLAIELGFASHSHFTVAFRRVFGVPPSALAGGDRSARRILETLAAAG